MRCEILQEKRSWLSESGWIFALPGSQLIRFTSFEVGLDLRLPIVIHARCP
jgi:hypothetical protein